MSSPADLFISPYRNPGRRRSWYTRQNPLANVDLDVPKWIWYPEAPVATDASRFFRRSFEVTSAPESARVFVTADDRFTLWLNGVTVNQTKGSAEPQSESKDPSRLDFSLLTPGLMLAFIQEFDVTNLLKIGENILAAEVYNGLPPAGFLLELRMNSPERKIFRLHSDKRWKVSKEATKGWQVLGFDDSSWIEALELGDVFIGPWYGTGNLHEYYPSANQSQALDSLRSELPARAEVRTERGGPRMFVNGDERFPLLAWSSDLLEFAPDFRDAGIHLLHPFYDFPNGWRGRKSYNWSGIEAVCSRLLDTDPEAFFSVRLSLSAPRWWGAQHPDELVKYGLPLDDLVDRWSGTFHASAASGVWRHDVEDALRDFLRYLEASPLRSRVIGYQVGYGIYGEWHYLGARYLPDLNPSMQEAMGGLSVDADLRQTSTFGLLRNPEKERSVIEFYRRFHEVNADTLLHFARVVKEETGRRVLCGAFYCYLLENLWIHEAGHLAPKRVLGCNDIDFIAAPYSYQNDVSDGTGNWLGRSRGVGGDGGYRVLLESIKRHGKLYIAEIDPTTCLELERKLEGGPGTETLEGSQKVLSRDLGHMLVEGNAGWVFDIGPGWYAHEGFISVIRRHVQLGRHRKDWDLSSVAEIAAVYDPESFFVTAHWKSARGVEEFDFFNEWFLNRQSRSLHRIGAPIDFLYYSDLTPADCKRYRFMIFPNLFALSREGVKELRRMLHGSGITVVWMYAPGFVSPERLDLEQMEELIGMQLAMLTVPGTMLIECENSFDKGLRKPFRFGINERHYPRFVVSEQNIEPLGRWVDQHGVAFARKQEDGWTSIYIGTAPVPVEILRVLAMEAGVTLWSDKPDIIYATKDAALLIATEAGDRRIQIPAHLVPVDGSRPAADSILSLEMGESQIWTKLI